MTTRTIHFDKELTKIPEPDAEAWRDWIDIHGLGDIMMWIKVPSDMTIDDDKNTIIIQRVISDKQGRIIQPFTIQLAQPAQPTPNGYQITHG